MYGRRLAGLASVNSWWEKNNAYHNAIQWLGCENVGGIVLEFGIWRREMESYESDFENFDL